jgi:orotate phosphoribosyltransferase
VALAVAVPIASCACCAFDALLVCPTAKIMNDAMTTPHVTNEANRRSLTIAKPTLARLGSTVSALDERTSDIHASRQRLVKELREHALVIGRVTLTSGATAEYYVDAKRAILLPAGFAALSELVADQAARWSATAVGGMTMGADPVACAALAGGADVKVFFVRKDAKSHGLQRRVEGPLLTDADRCVVVEDVVTTGSSTLAAIAALQEAGHEICGVISVLDRLAGGGAAIEAAASAPYRALSTIDEVYPDRPDRVAP